jgi:Flp pilus assembly protein TadG
MAVAFPLLILVCLGLVQFAIFYQAHNVVEAAVQDGARAAAAKGSSIDDGRRRANAILSAGLGKGVIVTIDWSTSNDELVEARASGSLPTFFPWFSFGKGVTHLSLPLDATARVSREHFRGGP